MKDHLCHSRSVEQGDLSETAPLCTAVTSGASCPTSDLFGVFLTRQIRLGPLPGKPPSCIFTNRSPSAFGIALPVTFAFQPDCEVQATLSRAKASAFGCPFHPNWLYRVAAPPTGCRPAMPLPATTYRHPRHPCPGTLYRQFGEHPLSSPRRLLARYNWGHGSLHLPLLPNR